MISAIARVKSLIVNRLIFFITTGLCVTLISWAGSDADTWLPSYTAKVRGSDYYHLLVDGLLDGNLHMKVSSTASGELPALMDASLYGGKYYMYFGITPVLITLLPYHLLTGFHLQLNGAIFIIVTFGFLVNLRIYALIRGQYFPNVNKIFESCAILLLALGSSTPTLLFNPGFYELALAAGYLCISASLLALYHTLHATRRATYWLTGSSILAGISVGCRPTYLLALPILLIPCFWHKNLRGKVSEINRYTLLKSAILPALIVGLFLMAYNYGRFKNPLEFGFKYQQNALMSSGLPFVNIHFILPNLNWYYLTPPVLNPHFPFILPINASLRPSDYYGYERIHGQWLVMVLFIISFTGFLWAIRSKLAMPRNLKLALSSIIFTHASVFLALLTFGFRANRYVSDFQPALILALTIYYGFIITHLKCTPKWLDKSKLIIFCIIAISISVFNYLAGIQWMDRLANTRPYIYNKISYYANYPSYWLYKLGINHYGPCQFEITFPEKEYAGHEFLMSTGTDTYTDTIYSIRHSADMAIFSFQHYGNTSLNSNPFKIKPRSKQLIRLESGSLYPPSSHPYFYGWSDIEIARVKTTTRLLLDEVEIVNNLQSNFDAPPNSIKLSHSPFDTNSRFSGAIENLMRLPHKSSPTKELGVWRLVIKIPENVYKIGQPLLASGISGQGSMLFVESLGPNEIRLGLDEWGPGVFSISNPIKIDPLIEHKIDIIVGPQIALQNAQSKWKIGEQNIFAISEQLQVWIDDQLAWKAPVNGNHSSYNRVGIGTNPQGFSTASSSFGGTLRKIQLSSEESNEILLRCFK